MYVQIATNGYGDTDFKNLTEEEALSDDWFPGWDSFNSYTHQVQVYKFEEGKDPKFIKGESNEDPE